MTLADLANYEARIRQPVASTYRGYELYGMPLPSSGGVTVAEALNILEGYDLKSMPRANAEHLYLEASRLAFADRNAYLADPEYIDAPVAGLLSKEFAAERRTQINPQRAAANVAAGDPVRLPGRPEHPAAPAAAHAATGECAHHPLHGVGQGRQRGLLHLHHRILGRQRHRGAGLRLPAQ